MEIYNLKSPAVKRLMREAEELRNATEVYYAQPLEDNLFEWHFTVRGPPKSDFDGGIYHGRILLPVEYPMKPPNIILLTPNGRFEVNKKICLSISGHHPETWQPSWSIRTALLAIIGFMPTHGNGAIGSLDYSPEERQSLARKSRKWRCPECGSVKNLLCEESNASTSTAGNEIEEPTSCYTKEIKEEEDMKSEITVTNRVEMDVNTQPHISFEPSIDKIFEPLHPPEPSDVTHSVALEESGTLQNQVRQRLLPQASNENHSTPDIPDELTHVSDYQLLSLRTLTTACMYVIVFLLGVLIIRRLFFF